MTGRSAAWWGVFVLGFGYAAVNGHVGSMVSLALRVL